MSVREEDRQKNSPSRGLGIAATAIGVGVGVGVALYYFFNKKAENPNGEGSTTDWTCEPHSMETVSDNENSYYTVSEHSTSDTSFHNSTMDDTSMHDTSFDTNSDSNTSETHDSDSSDESNASSNSSSQSEMSIETESSAQYDSERSIDSPISTSTLRNRAELLNVELEFMTNMRMNQEEESRLLTELSHHLRETVGIGDSVNSIDSESEWDVTESSLHVPNEDRRTPLRNFFNNLRRQRVSSPRDTRERSWTLEECSICFDVMLQTQEVMALACTHRFHQQCIMPWLQERQTCPNCRKVA